MDKQEQKDLPKLVGTNFVKRFREYLISLVIEDKYKENDIVRKAYLEKNVKPETTRKYLSEMVLLEIMWISEESELYYMVQSE